MIVEIFSPWGEYYATTPNSIPPHVYMDMVVQSGIPCDAFGLRFHFGKNEHGMHIRDMMQISAMLDTFSSVSKPLHITDVQVPCENGTGVYSGTVAGIWHNKWDREHQSKWIEQFYKIALSKSFVESVVYGNLVDSDNSTIASSGLISRNMEPKESYRILRKLFKTIYHR